jgi:cytochrome P450
MRAACAANYQLTRLHTSASANVTVNTYWCAIDVFKDNVLLEAVRKEVQQCKTASLQFETNKLVQQPLLQAVFAESLRLRCHNMFIRQTTEAISLVDWVIPKARFVIAWSTPGQSFVSSMFYSLVY